LAEFKQLIEEKGIPALVSFDHDLELLHYGHDYSDGKTGLEALQFLLSRLDGQKPILNIHTRNVTRGSMMRRLTSTANLPTLSSDKQARIMEHVHHQDTAHTLTKEPITI
jgi:hypothetical protein